MGAQIPPNRATSETGLSRPVLPTFRAPETRSLTEWCGFEWYPTGLSIRLVKVLGAPRIWGDPGTRERGRS